MSKQSIAIVGLGRVGSVFLEELLRQENRQIEIVAVAESGETPGKAVAKSHSIAVMEIDALIAKGEGIDILFDLTGSTTVRKELRDKLMATNNRHTVIATEAVARFVWSLISSETALPNVHGKGGY